MFTIQIKEVGAGQLKFVLKCINIYMNFCQQRWGQQEVRRSLIQKKGANNQSKKSLKIEQITKCKLQFYYRTTSYRKDQSKISTPSNSKQRLCFFTLELSPENHILKIVSQIIIYIKRGSSPIDHRSFPMQLHQQAKFTHSSSFL